MTNENEDLIAKVIDERRRSPRSSRIRRAG